MLLVGEHFYGVRLKNDFCYFFLHTLPQTTFQIQSWEAVWALHYNRDFNIKLPHTKEDQIILRHKWKAWQANM